VKCYCPKIGVCELSEYSVGFNKLVSNGTSIGKHNREYYFTLIVTNKARLVNIHRIDILVDDSPPVAGVVMEGTPAGKDVDYTSSEEVNVHWKGFIDHESGIRQYVIGVSNHCQHLDELKQNTSSTMLKLFTSDVISATFKLQREGKHYFSIFAYNNAMESSTVVCTDGITLDKTPPFLTELILSGARAKDIVACFNFNPYLVLENLTSVHIHKSNHCLNFCSSATPMQFLPLLPSITKPYKDTDFADHVCTYNMQYSPDWFMYLPSDRIQLSWNISDSESQIDDVLIGFASDVTQKTKPDLEDFVSAQTLRTYLNYHEGLDRGVPFYIIIKAINKANLESISVYGPVIIDLTPPQYKGGLRSSIHGGDFFIAWNNDTFLEMEQKEKLDTILFRFGE